MERLEILLKSSSEFNMTRTYSQIREAMWELSKTFKSLQNSFEVLQIDHPQICKDQFVFDKKEWINYSKEIYNNISEGVAKQGISFENKRLKYY